MYHPSPSALTTSFTTAYFSHMGYNPTLSLQAVTDSELSIGYPMIVKRFADRTVVCIAEEIEDAIPEINKMPPESSFDDFFALIFEPDTPCERDLSFISVYDSATAAPATLPENISIRKLDPQSKADKKLFALFARTITKKELALAQVSLDDKCPMGLFADGELVSAASLVAWNSIMDIGIMTRPDMRKKGYGKLIVQKLCEEAAADGALLQYRCDKSNAASYNLMLKAGFVPAVEMTGLILKI